MVGEGAVIYSLCESVERVTVEGERLREFRSLTYHLTVNHVVGSSLDAVVENRL